MVQVAPGRLRFAHVTVDCADAQRLVAFWRPLLGTEREPRREGAFVYLPWDAGAGSLAFQEVPEGRSGKNRAHLDFVVNNLTAITATVLELGGTVVCDIQEQDGSWRVFCDPEGNEFCVAEVPA
jgi:predicted enzyme related to lactoylglutathione lyase